jgi:hypothetical protein
VAAFDILNGVPVAGVDGGALSLARSVSSPASGLLPATPGGPPSLGESAYDIIEQISSDGEREDGPPEEEPPAKLGATNFFSMLAYANATADSDRVERPPTRRGYEHLDLRSAPGGVGGGMATPSIEPRRSQTVTEASDKGHSQDPISRAAKPLYADDTRRPSNPGPGDSAAVGEQSASNSEVEDFPSSLPAYPEDSADAGGSPLHILAGLQSFKSQEWQPDSILALESGLKGLGGVELPSEGFGSLQNLESEGWAQPKSAASGKFTDTFTETITGLRLCRVWIVVRRGKDAHVPCPVIAAMKFAHW